MELIRASCRVVGLAHRALREGVRAGVTTQKLDRVAEDVVRDCGAEPAFKGYHGFPATACISINEQVIHGIPGARELSEGDVVSIDLGAKLAGYYGDQAVTVSVGEVPSEVHRLLEATRTSLFKGIEAAQVGGRPLGFEGPRDGVYSVAGNVSARRGQTEEIVITFRPPG